MPEYYLLTKEQMEALKGSIQRNYEACLDLQAGYKELCDLVLDLEIKLKKVIDIESRLEKLEQ